MPIASTAFGCLEVGQTALLQQSSLEKLERTASLPERQRGEQSHV
jgi:hypothetical protein